MVKTTCAVRGCYSSSYIHKDLMFHQLPRTEERCKLWAKACGRADLLKMSMKSLKNTYICSLHFGSYMYGKRTLKKSAVPLLRIPTDKESCTRSTQTKIANTTVKTELCIKLIHDDNGNLMGSSEHLNKDYSKTPTTTDCTLKSMAEDEVDVTCKKELPDKNSDITEAQFLKGCDKFLPEKLSAYVKTQVYFKMHSKNDTPKIMNYFD
ncbi:uncharacterized protein LOC119192404 [Manduca sexta]|uniref:uncharacterized protein LOC119192404 n=1 Tax=Manduca sexta TaxID=7130 RepID=UPI00188E335B|nr:uncharacterized protein LOC119192404 [Manduca sexta]